MIVRMRVGHPLMNEIWDPVEEVWFPYNLSRDLRRIWMKHDISAWDAMWFTAHVNMQVAIT
jgi:hypothetical protein